MVPTPVALGINSKQARDFDQLHIHMARARWESWHDLAAQDNLAARTVANSRRTAPRPPSLGAAIDALITRVYDRDNLQETFL